MKIANARMGGAGPASAALLTHNEVIENDCIDTTTPFSPLVMGWQVKTSMQAGLAKAYRDFTLG